MAHSQKKKTCHLYFAFYYPVSQCFIAKRIIFIYILMKKSAHEMDVILYYELNLSSYLTWVINDDLITTTEVAR